MGVGLMLFIYSIVILVFSVVLGTVILAITWFFGKKEKRKRRRVLAFLLPFILIGTTCFGAFVGTLIVSEAKNVDIGMGDCWYVPLADDHQLMFIDVMDYASIQSGDELLIDKVTHLQQQDSIVLGKTDVGRYFCYNMAESKLIWFNSEERLTAYNSGVTPELMTSKDFHAERRFDITFTWGVVVWVMSIAVAIFVVCLVAHLILGKPEQDIVT